jgi:MoxR-like ATPase
MAQYKQQEKFLENKLKELEKKYKDEIFLEKNMQEELEKQMKDKPEKSEKDLDKKTDFSKKANQNKPLKKKSGKKEERKKPKEKEEIRQFPRLKVLTLDDVEKEEKGESGTPIPPPPPKELVLEKEKNKDKKRKKTNLFKKGLNQNKDKKRKKQAFGKTLTKTEKEKPKKQAKLFRKKFEQKKKTLTKTEKEKPEPKKPLFAEKKTESRGPLGIERIEKPYIEELGKERPYIEELEKQIEQLPKPKELEASLAKEEETEGPSVKKLREEIEKMAKKPKEEPGKKLQKEKIKEEVKEGEIKKPSTEKPKDKKDIEEEKKKTRHANKILKILEKEREKYIRKILRTPLAKLAKVLYPKQYRLALQIHKNLDKYLEKRKKQEKKLSRVELYRKRILETSLARLYKVLSLAEYKKAVNIHKGIRAERVKKPKKKEIKKPKEKKEKKIVIEKAEVKMPHVRFPLHVTTGVPLKSEKPEVEKIKLLEKQTLIKRPDIGKPLVSLKGKFPEIRRPELEPIMETVQPVSLPLKKMQVVAELKKPPEKEKKKEEAKLPIIMPWARRPAEPEIRRCATNIFKIKKEVSKALIGQHEVLNGLVMGLLCNAHILVEGVPGIAKTLAIRSLAKVSGCSVQRIQFTVDMLPTDIIGLTTYTPEKGFEVIKGPIFANFLIADEINRSPPKTQSALIEGMQERQVTIGKERFMLPSPFFVMATENPIESAGVYPLPEAQIDRFLFKLVMGYPKSEEERIVMETNMTLKKFDTFDLKPVVTPEEIVRMQEIVKKVYTDESIKSYILSIVRKTRKRDFESAQYITYGSSPRASIGLYIASKARAIIEGRNYVLPEDVKNVVYSVLRHRLILSYKATIQKISPDAIIKDILKSITVE